MARKCFSVNVHLQLHAITCPGVWLCPSGDAALRITALGSALESHRVSPIFPLLLHDEFTFKKTFTRLAALTELQRCLEEQCLHAELIQWLCPSNQPVLLATFEASLADVLYPTTRCGRLLTGLDVDLLMEPSKYFPGILAPKIEISTRTTIEEVTTRCDAISHRAHVFNPKTIDSKRKSCAPERQPVKGIIRQRRVCHSRGKRRDASRHRNDTCDVYPCRGDATPSTEKSCYPTRDGLQCPCNDLRTRATNRRFPPVGESLHVFDSCNVCSKYRCYFSREREHVSSDDLSGNPPDPLNYPRCSCRLRSSPDRPLSYA